MKWFARMTIEKRKQVEIKYQHNLIFLKFFFFFNFFEDFLSKKKSTEILKK